MSATDSELQRLYATASRYRAAEEEIAWVYFNSAARDANSDALWLRRQCFKEIWGSGVGDPEKGLCAGLIAQIGRLYAELDAGADRGELLDAIDDLRAEFSHYCLFAELYEEVSGQALRPAALEGWAADEALAAERLQLREQFGEIGDAAVRFTEGGSGSLYLAGIRLAGRGGLDEKIAVACRQVYDDEIGHMQAGAARLEALSTQDGALDELQRLIRKIMGLRLRMRNEQFGHPVSDQVLRDAEIDENVALRVAG
jgi:hypothetical protein